MLLFAAIWFLLPETLTPEHRQSLHPVKLARAYFAVFSHPRFLALAFAISFNFSGFVLYVMSAPTFLMEHLGVSAQGFLWLFGPAMVGMVSGSYLSSRLAGKVSHGRTVGVGYIIMSIGAIINVALNYWLPPSLPWAVLPLAVYVFGLAIGIASISLSIMDLFPERRGLASSCQGAMQTGMNAVVASVLVPLVWHSTLSMALAMLALLVLGLIAFAFRLAGGKPA